METRLELYLVRHGKTVFNTIGRLQGWSDSPLTPEGRSVAARLGERLAQRGIVFDAAFSSTSPRAADTAHLLLRHSGQPDLPLQTLADLREYCFGGLEGERTEEVHRLIAAERGFADTDSWLAAYRSSMRNLIAESISRIDPLQLAETEARFVGRLQQGLQTLVQQSPTGGRVLLVSHGMAITAILKSIDAACTPYQSVPNASLTRLDYADGRWQVLTVGEAV